MIAESRPRPVSDATARFYPAAGTLRPCDWIVLAEAARNHGDGHVYLAAHSSVELRQVRDPKGLAHHLESTSLTYATVPAVASPLSARARALTRAIVRLIVEGQSHDDAAVAPASSPLVGVDSGAGDILALRPRFGAQLTSRGAKLIVHGDLADHAEQRDDAAVAELVATAALESLHLEPHSANQPSAEPFGSEPQDAQRRSARPIGWLAEHQPAGMVDLGAGLRGGVLSADHAELLGRMKLETTVTPWRGIVLHDVADGDADVVLRVLAPRGFIFDAASPLLDS